jgi:Uma2 family endonuclease
MYLDSPAKPTGEKRMAFQALDWSAFQQIRQLLTERTRARFNYDDGVLEITMPLEGHERIARLVELFIRILVVEMGLKVRWRDMVVEHGDEAAFPGHGKKPR